jgi:hypothetical protein
MMFLVSEVHPFADGNGHIARIMMNAVLVAAGENRNHRAYRIPQQLSHGVEGAIAEPNHWSSGARDKFRTAVHSSSRFAELDQARFILDQTHAFCDPNEADAAGIRLTLPTSEILTGSRAATPLS